MSNDLETRLAELEVQADRSLAYFEVQNLQSEYNHGLDTGGVGKVARSIFTEKDPRVKTEIGGIYEGPESLKRMWDGMASHLMTATGILGTIFISTPYIEVSEDGKSAKGMWYGFGPNTFPITPYPGDEEKLHCFWIMLKYVDEFVKEGDEWKMLSFHLELYFRTPYDQGWVKQPDGRRFLLPPGIKPDWSDIHFRPYHPHEYNQFIPVPGEES